MHDKTIIWATKLIMKKKSSDQVNSLMCMRKTQTKKATTWQEYMPLRLQFSILAISRLTGQKSAQKEESVKIPLFFSLLAGRRNGLGIAQKATFQEFKTDTANFNCFFCFFSSPFFSLFFFKSLEYTLEEVGLGSGIVFSLKFSRFSALTLACLSKSFQFVRDSKDLFLTHTLRL